MHRGGKWLRLARGERCPVCQHDSWCTVSGDKDVVRCMRVKSGRESVGRDGSMGWIHAMTANAAPRVVREKPQQKLKVDEVTKKAVAAYENPYAGSVRKALAKTLGVTVKSLEMLRVGFGCDADGREWSSWPSRNSRGQVIGITRRYEDGSKKTLYGTRNGLFFAADWKDVGGPVLVVEGGSDVAAAYSKRLCAVGRPSNTGGAGWIGTLIGERRCVVIGERDEAPERRGKLPHCPADCAGCGHCFPGRFGAEVVAEKLEAVWVLPPEGSKDLREALSRLEVWDELIRACG